MACFLDNFTKKLSQSCAIVKSIELVSKMWNLFAVFLIAVASECTIPVPKKETSLSRAVSDIIRNFFMEDAPTVNFIHASETTESYQTIQSILNEIVYQSSNYSKLDIAFQLDEVNSLQRSYLRPYEKKSRNVILCDTLKSFGQIFLKIQPELFEFEGYFLIVISQYNVKLYETMLEIFGSFWSRHIVNVNILWSPAENDDDTLMYTYWPYSRFYCGEAYPLQLNQYREGKWLRRVSYFPNKLANMYGCPLHVATFPNPPFTIISGSDDEVSVAGIDGILLRVLSQRMNFKVKVQLVNDLWGEVDIHGNATGENKC